MVSRIDLIGQNGNDGLHYGHILPKDTTPDNIIMKIAEASYRMDKMDVVAEERELYITEAQYEWILELRTDRKPLERLYDIHIIIVQ